MPDLYIGKSYSPTDGSLGDRFMLDSSDLVTHGIVIGMTGSGKTGLSISLIEELVRARIPVIVIDPKGDMGNLALAFDRLAPEQFEPWVDRDEAAREGKTPADYAAAAAAAWTKGLADWGLGPADVAAYAASRRVRLFTPGAKAGISLNLIDSMAAPGVDFEANEEELRDEIDSIVSGLLGFVKIEADPVSSREYILLFSLIEGAWRKGEGLTLETLIAQVGNPPLAKVGALPLDSFYPPKERTALMFALNNLVASPPFEVWRQGEPIDIEAWVRAPGGLPQISIISTAHLDDDERIFVTALILNKLKTWMRKQPGTSELRCLFYMDEIFGYFPPTANPPTKKPLLTLLKQARAYGVGVLLSTQNPVDLDYKGLGNMGFWAIGRLQTEQDQARIREGIEAALEGGAPGEDFDKLMAGVTKRVFLIHDIHRKRPELVHSRWAMSYLRGPITRDEIARLTEGEQKGDPGAAPRTAAAPTSSAAPASQEEAAPTASAGAMLPSGMKPTFFRLSGSAMAMPHVFVKAAVRYRSGGTTSDEFVQELGFPIGEETPPGELLEGEPVHVDDAAIAEEQPPGLSFGPLPAYILTDGMKAIDRAIRERLDDRLALDLIFDPVSKQFSNAGEDEWAFADRLNKMKLPNARRTQLEARIAKKRADLEIRHRDAEGRRNEKWVAVGTSIFNNVFGSRRRSPSLGGIFGKSRMEQTAEARSDAAEREIAEMEQQLAEMDAIDPSRFQKRVIKPSKTDISVIRSGIVWVY